MTTDEHFESGAPPPTDPGGSLRVLLVDDHSVVRSAIRQVLESEADLTVVGEASDGREGVNLADDLLPDVVLMDISMPKLNGIDAAREIHLRQPTIGIIALTMHDEAAYFHEIVNAGGQGYLLKDSAPDELAEAVRLVASGQAYLSPAMAARLVRAKSGEGDGIADSLKGLTEREAEVFALVAEGLSNSEIASRLVVSIKTVGSHRFSLMKKLGLHDSTEVVKYAIQTGLINLSVEEEIPTSENG